jgi:6-phosphofructokinase 1
MNIAVKMAVKISSFYNFKITGILQGFKGLIEEHTVELKFEDLNSLEDMGGSFLGTNRKSIKDYGLNKIIDSIKNLKLDGLIVIGGFDAFVDMQKISEELKDFKIICIPATISNNIPCTEVSIGQDTALNNILFASDSLSNSFVSNCRRVYMLEVTGNYCGYLSVVSGLSSAACATYFNEKKLDLKRITSDIENLNHAFTKESQIMLIHINEKTDKIYTTKILSEIFELETNSDISVKSSILGHVKYYFKLDYSRGKSITN